MQLISAKNYYLVSMSSTRSPKSAATKKNSKSSSKKNTHKSSNAHLSQEEDSLELGQFYCSATPTSANTLKRPQPLRLYINIQDIQDMQLSAGDFVFVKRKLNPSKKALGVAWPMQAILSSNCQMASIMLENCDSIDGDIVNVEMADDFVIRHADSIRVELDDKDRHLLSDSSFPIYVKEVLIDLEYMINGQKMEATYFGRSRRFTITMISDEEEDGKFIGRITRNSQIVLESLQKQDTLKKQNNVGYDSIGGLKDQIKAIREMIELPLFYPEKFTKFGLSPPKGVLLFGPAGTGKTLIARAVAAETKAHVLIVNSTDIIGQYVGETEEKLKTIFHEASVKSPCIIFIDEIDALCPSRDDNSSDSEKRIVASLLTLMDGVDENIPLELRPRVVVIGATNRPNSIDSAMRRPGRFDREFEIGIPSSQARFEILNVLLKTIKHSLVENDVKSISEKAHGYVGADLAAICREAGMHAIRRVKKSTLKTGVQDQDLAVSVSQDLVIGMQDMMVSMSLVKPTALREISLEIPKIYWSQIGGQEDIKQKLKEAVEWPLKHPEVFTRFNINPPKGLLLYGPPGCSKTLMAKALATEAGLNFLAVKGPELFSKWVGDSEKAVQNIFKKARAASPSIIFFDEIDALAVKRTGDSAVADRVLSQLLMEMDGIEPLVNVTIIAATNRPDIIDSALLRPGRIDSILYVSPPDLPSRASIFSIQLQKIPNGEGVDSNELAELTGGFSGAEVVAVCQNAASAAMMESLDAQVVEKRHFLEAISKTTKRITPEMLQFYKSFRERSSLALV